MNVPWIRVGVFSPIGKYNISPLPRSFSAPPESKIVLESIWLATAKLILDGMFALTTPVITSVEGLWVATIKWIPAALAICVILIIESSTSLAATSIRSASSSIITTIYGSFGTFTSFVLFFFSIISL